MARDRSLFTSRIPWRVPGKARKLRVATLMLITTLVACGPASGSVPAVVLSPTAKSTPAGTELWASPTPGASTPFPTSTLFTPTPSLPSPSAPPAGSISEAVVAIDNVTVTIRTPFLPNSTFGVSSPGSANQGADSSSPNPFRELAIIGVPFGTIPGANSDRNNPLPVAEHGGADAYRAKLREYKVALGGKPQPGPAATLFGQQVTSDVALLNVKLNTLTEKPTLYVEWVVEAGPRLWIVRIVKQMPDGTEGLSGEQAFLQSLQSLVISSDNTDNPSTLPAKGTEPGTPEPPVPSATSTSSDSTPQIPKSSGMPSDADQPDTLFPPPWWNGDICDYTHYFNTGWRHIGSYQLGGSYMHLDACGPKPLSFNPPYDVLVSFGAGGLPGQSVSQYEWECVELTKRYLRLRFNINPYSADGSEMVDNYAINKATSNPNGPDLEVVLNGGQPPAPQPGDILSYGPTSADGHTSLVKSVNVNSSGNGSITVVEQNHSNNGLSTLTVQNWFVISNVGGNPVTKWLVGSQHYQPAAESNQDGRLEVFVRGQDGALWHKWQDYPNCCWSGWASEGGVILGNPAVVRHQHGVLEVFGRGSDRRMYKKYQVCPGCGWSGWESWGSAVKFQGSPVAIVNDSSYYAYVFGWGADNQIWYSYRNYSTGVWSDWISIPSISTTNAVVAMDNRVANNHRVTVFHRGIDNAPYYSQQSCPTCGFGSWTSLGGTLDGPPAVGTTVDGRLVAFGLGTDTSGALYRNSQQTDGTWGGWISQGGMSSRGPVVTKNLNGALEVYVIQGGPGTYQNHLFRKTQLDTWSSWTDLGGDWHVGLMGAARSQDGRLMLFARGDDRNMYNLSQNSANSMGWTCCTSLGGQWP